MELYETLQAEFCPPLDTSLLAAIIADHAVEVDTTLTSLKVENIRETLRILADQAQTHEHELEEMQSVEASLDSFSNMSTTSPTTPELCDSTTSTNSGSDISSFQHSFNSPLGFLQEAFSEVPIQRLKRLLRKSNRETLEVDMESVIEYILNMEHIRELEERGLDALEPDPLPSPNEDWETVVRTKPKSAPKLATPTKNKAKGRTIKLVDVRQTQHIIPSPAKSKPMPEDAGVNPWVHISSLSTHLATLLPLVPASHFTSFFHSPTHATPQDALRAALAALPSTFFSNKHQTSAEALINLLRDSPTFANLDVEQRNTLCADVRLALAATGNKPDEALDIVLILWDLGQPGSGVGIYHLLPPPPSGTNSITAPTARAKLPTGPPPLQPPPTSKRKSISLPSSPTASENSWHAVPVRSLHTTHPLEDPNPVYKRKVRGAGNGLGKGGKGDEGQLARQGVVGSRHKHFTHGMLHARKERGELLREAGRAWRKPWGGEVARHYTQRAREVTDKMRADALDQARKLIQERRDASQDQRTVDLHGTCVQEAIVITSEILEREGCSRASPLCLITGRGTHSVGGVGVLKPAVHHALVNDGWDVRMWDGGLVVQGRERGR